MANEGINRDLIIGRNVTRPQHLIGGCQWAESSRSLVNGKRPAEGPPMMVGTTDPFLNADNDNDWIQTFGGSLDNTMAIINGKFVKTQMDNITVDGIYLAGTVNIKNDNIWRLANGYQQVQYLVSQTTAIAGSVSTGWYGSIEEVRGIGDRIPVLAAGYGRTIDGLPTDPSVTEDTNGRENDPEHKLDRATWKYGPKEYRWDYRKGVWSAYNEMVADHYAQNLGTWFFSTNPDTANGYPFLRGRMEDVFWVRQPTDLAGTNGRLAGIQTGRVFTHLNHRWFDPVEMGSAPLSSIFIIPHKNSTTPDCHDKGAEHSLGGELTGDGLAIDLKSSVHFFKDVGLDGAIAFGGKASEENVCCEPANPKYHMGKMIFKDTTTVCTPASSDTLIISSTPTTNSCEWVPAIAIDECEMMGGHLNDLIKNDVENAALNASLCAVLAAYSQLMRGSLAGNFAQIQVDFSEVQDNVESALEAILLCLNGEMMHLWTRLDLYRDQIEISMEELIAQLNSVFATCCEGATVSWDTPASVGAHDYPDPCTVDFDNFITIYGDVPEIPCDSCPAINMWTPCTESEKVTILGGCAPSVGTIPEANAGCSANDGKSSRAPTGGGMTGKLGPGGGGVDLPSIPDLNVVFAGAGFIGEDE